MHEMSIVEALIAQVEEEVRAAGHRGPVRRVELSIGRLSGVHPEAIRFAFEMLTPGTLLEDAEVCIDEPRAICHCQSCGRRTEMEDLARHCNHCGSDRVTIAGGRDLVLQTIELLD